MPNRSNASRSNHSALAQMPVRESTIGFSTSSAHTRSRSRWLYVIDSSCETTAKRLLPASVCGAARFTPRLKPVVVAVLVRHSARP